jgi:hypothetical protein
MIEMDQGSAGTLTAERLELLQRRINDEDYLCAAVQRIALVLSNELMEITTEGRQNERQRKRRK